MSNETTPQSGIASPQHRVVLWTSETINAWGCSSTVEREIKPRDSAGCASLFRRESRFDSGHPHFSSTERQL